MFKFLKILIFYWKKLLKQIENETKQQIAGFLGMLLGTLEPNLLGNMLTGKGMLRSCYGSKHFQFRLIL